MPTLGPTELGIILVLALVLFGAGRLADVGGALGKSIREFRKAATDEESPKKSAGLPPTGRSCPSCGRAAEGAVEFCSHCGAKLSPHEAA